MNTETRHMHSTDSEHEGKVKARYHDRKAFSIRTHPHIVLHRTQQKKFNCANHFHFLSPPANVHMYAHINLMHLLINHTDTHTNQATLRAWALDTGTQPMLLLMLLISSCGCKYCLFPSPCCGKCCSFSSWCCQCCLFPQCCLFMLLLMLLISSCCCKCCLFLHAAVNVAYFFISTDSMLRLVRAQVKQTVLIKWRSSISLLFLCLWYKFDHSQDYNEMTNLHLFLWITTDKSFPSRFSIFHRVLLMHTSTHKHTKDLCQSQPQADQFQLPDKGCEDTDSMHTTTRQCMEYINHVGTQKLSPAKQTHTVRKFWEYIEQKYWFKQQ